MTAPAVTITLPEPLYDRLKQRADNAQRTIEAEIIDLVATAVPAEEELPQDFADAIAALSTLSDDDLSRAARITLPRETSRRLERLHFKRQREGLTPREADTAARLVREYERVMLVRAHAALLLKQRGHDISVLRHGQ